MYCENNPVGFIDPLGLESYIFYTTGKNSDFSKQAQWQKQYQERQGEKVIMRTIDSVDDFIKAWGRIGVDDKGYTVTVNKVIIYSHSNGKSLILLDGSDYDALSVDGKNSHKKKIGDLSNLYYKNIRELYLLGCNTGNLDLYWSEGSNVASVMSNRISGVTYAYDGNVSFGKSSLKPWDKDIGLSSRLSTRQISFNRIAAANGRKGRTPMGKIQYYQGEYKIYGYYPNTRLSQ